MTHQKRDPLSVEEERALAQRWKNDQDAKALDQLVESHLGLVIRIAQDYKYSGPETNDLIQEGNIGLTIAAQRFDPNRTTRLATYATYWIRACMLEHIVRSHGAVRMGTTRHHRKIFFGFGKARRKVEAENHGVAGREQIAETLGVSLEELNEMLPHVTGKNISLDAPRSFDDERSLQDCLASDPSASPEKMVAEVEGYFYQKELFGQSLRVLDPREKIIIKKRHLNQKAATLSKLAQKLGVSRERIRQLELRAIAKIRQAMSTADAGVKNQITENRLAEERREVRSISRHKLEETMVEENTTTGSASEDLEDTMDERELRVEDENSSGSGGTTSGNEGQEKPTHVQNPSRSRTRISLRERAKIVWDKSSLGADGQRTIPLATAPLEIIGTTSEGYCGTILRQFAGEGWVRIEGKREQKVARWIADPSVLMPVSPQSGTSIDEAKPTDEKKEKASEAPPLEPVPPPVTSAPTEDNEEELDPLVSRVHRVVEKIEDVSELDLLNQNLRIITEMVRILSSAPAYYRREILLAVARITAGNKS